MEKPISDNLFPTVFCFFHPVGALGLDSKGKLGVSL